MHGSRVPLIALTCLALLAQDKETPPEKIIIRTTVTHVVVQALVTDRDNQFVNNLQAHQFRVYDNEKLQDIQMDVSFVPISLVVAVQANADMDPILPKIIKVGSMLGPQVIGEQGEAAIVSYDHRIRVMQDFTNDTGKLSEGMAKIKAGSSTSVQIDTVDEAVRMLRRRPGNRRRIILLVTMTRDKGSGGKMKDVLTDVEMANIQIYTVDVSRTLAALQKKTPVPRPDPIPPEGHHSPTGGVYTPGESLANRAYGSNTLPAFVALFREVKSIFIDNPPEIFTKFTGGKEYHFESQRDLEKALMRIGEELHAQYLLSYNPNDKIEGGFHDIRVEVANHSDYRVRHRAGYWLAAVPE